MSRTEKCQEECCKPKIELLIENCPEDRLVVKEQGHRSSTDLIELAKSVELASNFVKANAINKLSVVAEQVRFLHSQALKILEEAKVNEELHSVCCGMKKTPGNIYHLYYQKNGKKLFSMLSPEEWGSNCPYSHIGSYRLEFDQSWTPIDEIKEKDAKLAGVHEVFSNFKDIHKPSIMFKLNS